MTQNKAVPSRGIRLKMLRLKAQLNYREAEQKSGISFSQISKLEKNDEIEMRIETLIALARAYNTTVEYIESGQHQTRGTTRLEDEFAFVDTSKDEFIELPFIEEKAYGSFLNSCHDRNYGDFDTVRIVKRPGVDYKGAVVIEIRGNSMAPRYPERSRYVARPVSDGNWQHASGVHAISLRSEMFLIKRVVSNVNGTLRLKSDANGEEMEIMLGDINCMWKVGEASYMPAED